MSVNRKINRLSEILKRDLFEFDFMRMLSVVMCNNCYIDRRDTPLFKLNTFIVFFQILSILFVTILKAHS